MPNNRKKKPWKFWLKDSKLKEKKNLKEKEKVIVYHLFSPLITSLIANFLSDFSED